jgi:DNA sulfur modification protein DndC
VNHSAGKDSQVMMLRLAEIIPQAQLLVVHADLGEVEWAGNVEHIQATIPAGVQVIVAKPVRGLFQMVEQRGMWPSPKNRQCTSDLKRGPIEREVRRHLVANPQLSGLIVNCIGIRAQESASRSKAVSFKLNKKNSVAGREWYDWLPIFDMQLPEVWATIKAAGQEPHGVYAQGMTRLSCCFCIMASKADLTTAARLNPSLYRKVVALRSGSATR